MNIATKRPKAAQIYYQLINILENNFFYKMGGGLIFVGTIKGMRVYGYVMVT
jgi:hypothetical protein